MERIDNRYEVVKTLGSGLSGEVLCVSDQDGKKALKLLKKVQMNVSKEDALAAFKNEFSVLSELNHPGIARILDFGLDKRLNKYFFTTELIEGKDFFQSTEGRPAEVIEEVAVQVLRALNYLHSRNIYHFDIKPQNLLVMQKNGGMVAKIIDFGLAGFSSPRKKVGTPAYMAPEIILGGELDGRTDLYSFGVVLYKALTRQNPFASPDVRETLQRHRALIPPIPSSVNPALPKFWDEILMRLLEKNPSDRFPNGSAVIRNINFLAGRTYEIETIDTRLSYLPEKGSLVGRKKETEIFRTLFDLIFVQNEGSTNRLLIIEGKLGTGKSRLLSEFKYYSQLHEVPIHTWATFSAGERTPPFCLSIDETDNVPAGEVNRILQEFAAQKILILWATEGAPAGWSHCEIISLKNLTEEELTGYLVTVTGLTDPPHKLVREIFQRTDGNPLFVTELLKTMLANNLLLDASGRWVSSTFEDIGINFEKIQIPKTLSELLHNKVASLGEPEKKILDWLTVFNRSLSLESIRVLSSLPHPQSSILFLTKEDFIERTDREHHYFFTNVLLREVIYSSMTEEKRRSMHDEAALFLEGKQDAHEEFLYHLGRGSQEGRAVEALSALADKYVSRQQFGLAIGTMDEAWQRAQTMDRKTRIEVETKLGECSILRRDFKKASTHYEHLRTIYESDPELSRDLEGKIRIYEKLGDLNAKLDQPEAALKLFETTLKWLKGQKENRVANIIIQNHIASVFVKLGQMDKAEEMYRENHRRWEKDLTDDERKKVTNNWLADVLVLKKNYTEAMEVIGRDISFYEQVGDRYVLSRALYMQGDLCFKLMLNAQGPQRTHHKQQAITAFEKCLKLSREIDSFDMMLRAYNGIGNLHYYEKDYDRSTEDYERALAIARKLEDLQTAATIALNLGNIYKIRTKFRDAYAYLVYAMNTFETLENKNAYNWLHLFNCHIELAEALRELGELAKAEELLNKGETIVHQHEHLKLYEFWIWFERAKVYHKQKHLSLCRESLAKAEKLAREAHEIEDLKKFQEMVNASEPPVSRAAPAFTASWNKNTMTADTSDALARGFETLLQINKLINSEHDPEHVLKMILNFALELSGAEAGHVLLVNPQGELEVKAAVNTKVSEELTKFSSSVAKKALASGEVVISEDALADGRFDSSQSIVLNELKSVLCLPLRSRNKTIGVLYLDNRYQTNAFAKIDMRLLNAFGDQVGIALENARLFSESEGSKKRLEEELEKTTGELKEVKEILRTESSMYLTRYSYTSIIAKSKPMQEIFKILDKITETNLTVFLHGASGTGKELIARALHVNNPQRAEKRFVAINCGAIPANLIESELFGYKAGSFTGASRDKKGLFEEAHGGTLLLDEVAELETQLQVKLLRVLQEGEVQRVGDVKPVKVDVRIVAASHKSLEEMVKKTTFREDLFYRLCQIKISLPPLAERKEDIPLLAEHFIEKFRKEQKLRDKLKIGTGLMKAFFQYAWPGNVRELENTINVACALRNGTTLELSVLPPNYGIAQAAQQGGGNFSPVAASGSDGGEKKIPIDEKNFLDPGKTWDQYETIIIAKCYEANTFKKAATAEMLDISPSTLYKKIREADLDNRNNPLYADPFVYPKGETLKAFIPKIFKSSLEFADNHPYAAIRRLGISQGYFYKIMKKAEPDAA